MVVIVGGKDEAVGQAGERLAREAYRGFLFVDYNIKMNMEEWKIKRTIILLF